MPRALQTVLRRIASPGIDISRSDIGMRKTLPCRFQNPGTLAHFAIGKQRLCGHHGGGHQIGRKLVCLQRHGARMHMIHIQRCHGLGRQQRGAFLLHRILAVRQRLLARLDQL